MIFVTVGSDLPFDRLVKEIDQWARQSGRADVFAQIGRTPWRPAAIQSCAFLHPQEYKEHMARASVIIAHAGMGTILSALKMRKPILVFPRRAALKEVRNEHQLATARYLAESGRVRVAFDEPELRRELNSLAELRPGSAIPDFANESLLRAIRDFIATA